MNPWDMNNIMDVSASYEQHAQVLFQTLEHVDVKPSYGGVGSKTISSSFLCKYLKYRPRIHGTRTMRGGGLGSSTISKNLMSPTPRRKWYLTTGRRAH